MQRLNDRTRHALLRLQIYVTQDDVKVTLRVCERCALSSDTIEPSDMCAADARNSAAPSVRACAGASAIALRPHAGALTLTVPALHLTSIGVVQKMSRSDPDSLYSGRHFHALGSSMARGHTYL